MRRLRALALRLSGVLGAGRRDREIDSELRTHRDMLADQYLRSGMTAEAARQRAAADFGSIAAASDAYRDRRGLPALEQLTRDGRLALRSLTRTPLLTASMILVLGLGVGIATAVAAVFHALVWDTLPVNAPEAVVRLTQQLGGQVDRRVRGNRNLFSYPEFEQYRQTSRTFVAMAAASDVTAAWRRGDDTRRLHGMLVTGEYFAVFALTPAAGRMLTAADAQQPVVVISHRLWSSEFESRPDAIGQSLPLDGSLYTIVGVAPASFAFSGSDRPVANFWMPLEARHALRGEENTLREPNVSWLHVFARLGEGMSLPAARGEAASVAWLFDRDYPGRTSTINVDRASRVDRVGFQTAIVTAGGVLAAFLGLLLLICGSNAAGLLLARGTLRQKEIAIRLALGAGRGDIVRQLIAEVVVIAGASALVGVAICMSSLSALTTVFPLEDVIPAIHVDLRVLGVACAAAFAISLLFGVAPARQALAVNCLVNLKGEGSLVGVRISGLRLRRVLISLQVAVSVPLLVGAALLGRGVSQAWRANPGYETAGLYAVQPETAPASASAALAARLAELPGVRAVSRAQVAPFFGSGFGRAGVDPGTPLEPSRFNIVDDRYFAALGVSLLAGRSFEPGERDVVIVNARLARKFWTDEPAALGRVLFIPESSDAAPEAVRVIGVVPTLQTTTIGVPDEPTYYLPFDERPASWMVVRAEPGAPVERLLVEAARSAHPDAATSVTSIDTRLLAATMPARVAVLAVGSIGILALIVAAVGVHGVIAFTVSSRARDIGIYQALGARPAWVLALILNWTMRGVAFGTAAAVAVLALAATIFRNALRPLLSGIDPLDLPSFAAALAILGAAMALAACLPALRAIGLTPLAALRRE
jgi:putative ABC transport system permease protein